MKRLILFAVTALLSLSATAQVFTYTTRIGDYKGPVKSVLLTSDVGVMVDYYSADGRIEKSLNSTKDEYTVFVWSDNQITQKFFDRSTDNPKGKSILAYEEDDSSFIVGNSSASYSWDFDESKLYCIGNNSVLWIMTTEGKTPEGYYSVMYVDNEVSSKNIVKTFDPDEYGNYTRAVTITPDGIEHERFYTYEYYE